MSPVAGSEIALEKVPAGVGVATAEAIERSAQPTIESALAARIPGVMINDAQGNTFNANIQYRGFETSPVNGFAQGLAVYQNGVRINEAFGDIVNLDAIPANAIAGATIMGSNPAFGLNAIGGSLNLVMKDGFTFQGAELDTRFGSFGRRQASVQAGMASGRFAAYLAGDTIEESGWRNFSPTSIRRVYADLGAKGDGTEMHLSLTAASNSFGVVSATPVPLLEIDRKLTFTSPQTTEHDVLMGQLSGSTRLTPSTQLAGVVYVRSFNQSHVDGNVAEIRRCGTTAVYEAVGASRLCASEGDFRPAIRDINGSTISAINAGNFGYGAIDRTQQDALSFGGSVQAVEKSRVAGLPNQFLIGASFDHGHVDYRASSELGTSNRSLVVNGTGIVLGDDRRPRDLSTTNDYVGLYFSNTLDLTRSFALTLGGRYNLAQIELADNTGFFSELNSKQTYQRFNPMVGATYKLVPGLSIYGGYSEANRAPTAAELACANPNNPCLIESFLTDDPPLKQVVSHTFEAGLRGQIVGGSGMPARLRWNLGVFHALNENDIISVASPEAGRGYFINAGNTLRRGVEAGIDLKMDKLSAYVGYSYVDATFRNALEIASPNNNFAGPCSADPSNDEVFCSHVRPGNKLPGISPHKLKVGADYEVLPQWRIGADWIWASSQYFHGDEGNVAPQLGSRTRVDLRTTYNVSEHLQFYGIVNNLFDNRYNTFGTFYSAEAAYNTSNRSIGVFNTTSDQRSVVPVQPFAIYGGVKFKM